MEERIDILVVNNPNLVRDIRRWLDRDADAGLKDMTGQVWDPGNLDSALAISVRSPTKTLSLVHGHERDDLSRRICHARQSTKDLPIEMILVTAQAAGKEATPSASPMQEEPSVSPNPLVGHLRKSLIKLRTRQIVEIRPFEAKDAEQARREYEGYFALRYKIWSELGYIKPERNAERCRLEVDYTDRSAWAVGAFTRDGRLVGCARLVRELGKENPFAVGIIQHIINKRDDPILRANFQFPRELAHPYDVLESFEGFREWYCQRRRQNRPMGELSRVIVDSETDANGASRFQKKGIGEALVDSISYWADRCDVHTLFLACLEKHRAFYERCGYRAVCETRGGTQTMMRCDQFATVSVPAIAMYRE